MNQWTIMIKYKYGIVKKKIWHVYCSDTETLRCKDVKYPTNDAWLAKNTLRYHEMTSAASHE